MCFVGAFVYLCWRHDVLFSVFPSNVLWFKAVIGDDDLYVAIEMPDAAQQYLELCVAQERLGGDGNLRADVCQTEERKENTVKQHVARVVSTDEPSGQFFCCRFFGVIERSCRRL